MALDLFTVTLNLLLSFQQNAFNSVAFIFLFALFGAISGAVLIISIILLLYRYGIDKLKGRGNLGDVLTGIFYGILHSVFAVTLIPACYYIVNELVFVIINSYSEYRVLEINKELIDTIIRSEMAKLFGGVENIFIYFLFAILIAYYYFKTIFMFIENIGVIAIQTCIFAILVFDTVLNEGVGTMKFFKVAIGTIIGQGLMIICYIFGLVLLFDGINFIIGLSLMTVASKLPTLVPNYLGSTGKTIPTGQSVNLNANMLTSAVQTGLKYAN